VQPGWEPGDEDDATFVQLGDQLRLAKSEDVLRLETAGTDDAADVDVSIADWNPGDWHQVTASWSEDGISLYLDGELVGRRLGRGLMHLPRDSELFVGSDRSRRTRVARGLIGRIDLRNRPLNDREVAKTYRDAIGDRGGRAEEPADHAGRDLPRSSRVARRLGGR
jgi:hypothetical protein